MTVTPVTENPSNSTLVIVGSRRGGDEEGVTVVLGKYQYEGVVSGCFAYRVGC